MANYLSSRRPSNQPSVWAGSEEFMSKKSHTSVMWTHAHMKSTMFKEGTGTLTCCLPRYAAVAVSVTIRPLTRKQRRTTFGP